MSLQPEFTRSTPGAFSGVVHRWLCAGACLLALLLAGCEDKMLYPVQARQEITLRQQGPMEMRYEGTFRDTYVELLQTVQRIDAAKGRSPRDRERPGMRQQYEQELLEAVRGNLADPQAQHMQVTSLGGHRYRLHYHETFTPGLLMSDRLAGAPKPALLMLGRLEEAGSAGALRLRSDYGPRQERDKLLQDGDTDAATRQAFAPLLELVQRIRGTLVIRTDGHVVQHNAPTVTPLANGLTEYQWQVAGDRFPQPAFTVVLGAENYRAWLLEHATAPADCAALSGTLDHARCQLKVAPAGSRCSDIIGQDCQCGPFRLLLHTNQPQASRRYEIRHPQGRTTGCTDAQGMIPAVTGPVTGSCSVTVLGACNAPRASR